MRKKSLFLIVAVIVLLIGGVVVMMFVNNEPKFETFNIAEYNNYIAEFPSDKILGTVDRAETAKEKAENVWTEIYGDSIKKQKPYKVFFDEANDVWLITGSMPRRLFGDVVGGVANIIIQKSDGKVLAVWHDK